MIRGLYSAAAGLATVTLRLGVVSNNVANAATPGYKQDRLPDESGKALNLTRMATGEDGTALGALSLGPRSGLSELDLSPGVLQQTDNPLDLALGGGSFFAVRRPDGETRYTRDGGFHLDAAGVLRARDESAVLGADGQPITSTAATFAILPDGTLYGDDAPLGKLLVVDFAPGQVLRKVGSNQFVPEDNVAPALSQDPQVYQGYLEGSNVDMTDSMVAVMSLVRAYEANQRLLQMQDESVRRAANEIGKV